MTLVRASIDIDAPREQVYDLVLDPSRLDEWVTIHRRINARRRSAARGLRDGADAVPARQLQGDVDADRGRPPRPRHLGGPRPAPSYARTSYSLNDTEAAARSSDYENEFKAPGGFLGAAAFVCSSAACPSARRRARCGA